MKRTVALILTAMILTGIAHAGTGDISLQYLGAFREKDVDWGSGALAYYPGGNGGVGSLWGYVPGGGGGMYEITIPDQSSWSTSVDPSSWPDTTIIAGPTNVASPYGLEYLPALPGQTNGKLYHSRPNGPHGYMDPDLTNLETGWSLANVDNRRLGGYLFEIPDSWRSHVGGKPLVTGDSWSDYGKGPDLYAYDPNPAPGETTLAAEKLLEYNSSHPYPGWESGDDWNGGAWVEVGTDSAVIFGGKKNIGGVGRLQFSFYDPNDFVSVLGGGNTYDPEPVKTLSVTNRSPFCSAIEGMAYDRANNLLYAAVRLEKLGEGYMVFEVVNDLATPHPGDANEDNVVDWEDYTILAGNYGEYGMAGFSDGGWSLGNFNEDDVVDEADLAIWEAEFGWVMPEPATAVLLVTGGWLVLRRRRNALAVLMVLLSTGLLASPAVAQETWDWATPMQYVAQDWAGGTQGSFSQFGDSISDTNAYFTPLRYSHSNVQPEDQVKLDWLQNWINPNSWNWKGSSWGNLSGTTVDWGLENMDSWLGTMNPQMCVIMWGTNDTWKGPSPTVYDDYLRFIVQKCKDNGTVPIVTTIPPRHEVDVMSYVNAAREVAESERVPLIDLYDEVITRRPHNPPTDTWDGADPMWSAYSGYEVPTLVARDGVHLSNWSGGRNNFDLVEGLNKNGYTLRNYLTLQKMYDIWEQVLSQPAPPPIQVGDVSIEPAYLGNGEFSFTLTVHGNDFQELPFGVSLEVTADAGTPIDTTESSVFAPWTDHAQVMILDDDSMLIEAGTGLGSEYETADLLYLVTSGDVSVTGNVARDGQNYPVNLDLALPLLGDVDLDGDVDASDLATLGMNWSPAGSDARWRSGDFHGDGNVDSVDLAMIGLHWNPGGTVPEPVSCVVLLSGSVLLLRSRRQSA